MTYPDGKTGSGSPRLRRFTTTRWSLIAAAGRRATPEAREALSTLCQLYWYPAYAFVRRQVHGAEEARDLTQDFFARLLEKNDLATVDRRRGRFRAWLLGSLKHHLANERDRARAQKRGGGRAPLPIDGEEAEGRYRLELSHDLSPDKLFERRWALALLEHVLAALRDECEAQGKRPLFEQLKGLLAGGQREQPLEMLARELGMTPGAVKVAAHRLRRRYRELLRAEVAQTVERPEEVNDELRDLLAALG